MNKNRSRGVSDSSAGTASEVLLPGEDASENAGTSGAPRERDAESGPSEIDLISRVVFESSPLAICVADGAGRVIQVNPRFSELLGYEIDEVVGKGVEVFTHPSDVTATTAKRVQNKTAEGPIGSLRKRYLAKDGRVVSANTSVGRLPERDGVGPFFIAMIEDVSESVFLEEQREEARLLFAEVTGASPDLLFAYDFDLNRPVFRSRSLRASLGYPVEFETESLREGDRVYPDLLHPDDVEPWAAYRAELLAAPEGSGDFEIEHRLRRADGEYVWYQTLSRVFRRHPDGSVWQAVGTAREIHRRKQAELELARSEARFRALAEFAPVGIFQADQEARASYINPQLATLLGVPADEALGLGWAKHAVDPEGVRRDWQAATAARQEFVREVAFAHPDGTLVRTLTLACPFAADAGVVEGYVGVNIDITEQKRAEEELVKRTDELERFAFIASHDLQEPLRTLVSFSQLLERDHGERLDEDGKACVRFIGEAGRRMRSLIEGLLQYSRLGRDRTVEEVSLHALLTSVEDDFGALIEESGAELRFSELPVVRGSEAELRMLFQNLLSNAIKFRAQDRAPRIEVRCRETRRGYECSVTDNGIGIPEGDRKRVFEVFRRLHSASEIEGAGIGLAHCRKIVDLHGGTISAESGPSGVGTTIVFHLLHRGEEAG